MEYNTIQNIDCLEGLRSMPASCANLVVTSPPYNVSLNYNLYSDNKPYDDYIQWMREIFTECYRVLQDDGRMCVNVGDGKNGSIPIHSDFIQLCKEIGFSVMATVVWNKGNASSRTAWGSFQSPSSPSFPCPFEYVLMFCKNRKLTHEGEATISKENFIKYSLGMWSFAGEKKKNTDHPAAFPLELPIRCIEMLTYKGDVVVDPFMGSGTTAVAAIKTDRQYVGFEIDEKYYNFAQRRIRIEQQQIKFN